MEINQVQEPSAAAAATSKVDEQRRTATVAAAEMTEPPIINMEAFLDRENTDEAVW